MDKTYTITGPGSEGHERLTFIDPAKEAIRIKFAGRGSPVLGRGMHVKVRKIYQHAGLQRDGRCGRHKSSLTFDDTECCRHAWVEAVDLHDDGVEVWHLGCHRCEVNLSDTLGFREELCEDVWSLL